MPRLPMIGQWRRRGSCKVKDGAVGVVATAAARLGFVDFVELVVGTAAGRGVVGRAADAVAVEFDGRGAEGGKAGADDAGAAFNFGPNGSVDGTPFFGSDVSG